VIEARALSAKIGGFALREVTFTVPRAKYGVVIGPAGSGKTTLIETIAGIVPQSGGSLLLDGVDVRTIPPDQRGLGLVYQHGYLFPHLSVAQNVAYAAANDATMREVIDRFEVGPLLERSVRALSGGERQLVALARALARRPSVLLLNEPFSALDPRRRQHARREVRDLHRQWGLTVLQVTHDFTEAGLLGDVAILLDAGRVLQHGPPDLVFSEPASPYVAEFLGAENVFAGTVRAADPSSDAEGQRGLEFRTGALVFYTVGSAAAGTGHAVVRSEEVVLAREPLASSVRNQFRGRISEIATLGALTRVVVDIDGVPLVAALTTRSTRELALTVGDEVYASFKAMAVHLC
jgi:molybdopterin-binding protein